MAKAKVKKVESQEERQERYSTPSEHFYWLKLINSKVPYRNIEELDYYPAFMVNKGLSYYPETVQLVNQMNIHSHLDERMQFDFLYKTINKDNKRFAKWLKPEKEELITQLQTLYKVSRSDAREYTKILNSMTDGFDIQEDIRMRVERGGRC